MLKRLRCFFGFHRRIKEHEKRGRYFGFDGTHRSQLCVNCGKRFGYFQTDEIRGQELDYKITVDF